jgi:hypothetical protein
MLKPLVTSTKAAARAETMLALAEFVGVDIDALEHVRRRLVRHETQYDAAIESSRRAELTALMTIDIAELAIAYKVMAAAVARGGEA